MIFDVMNETKKQSEEGNKKQISRRRGIKIKNKNEECVLLIYSASRNNTLHPFQKIILVAGYT